jgi:hypothetical protein
VQLLQDGPKNPHPQVTPWASTGGPQGKKLFLELVEDDMSYVANPMGKPNTINRPFGDGFKQKKGHL